jgi:RND family efflux transporter MFP subunit
MAQEDLSRLKIDKRAVSGKPGRFRRPLKWGALLVCLALLLVVARMAFVPQVQVEVGTVSMVYPSQSFTILNASGYVVAQRKAALAAKATGRLVWLGVEEGSRISAGEVIARLENQDTAAALQQAVAGVALAKANVEQARAELNDAGRAYKRQQELIGLGIVAQADFDTAEARYQRARAAMASAEASQKVSEAAKAGARVSDDYTQIRSPFDAVVLTKNADVGDIVTPLGAAANAKASVVTIADLGSLQVEADVSESNLAKVRSGQPCEIQLDAFPDLRFPGAVHAVVPTADRSKATVMVKVRFRDRDPRILPEMSAKVAFLERATTPAEQRPKIAINPAAIAMRNNRSVVYVIQGDKVKETPVTLGAKVGDLVEVRAGVKVGDKVVTKPLDKLRDGSGIKTGEK